jgi:hypothetical protein
MLGLMCELSPHLSLDGTGRRKVRLTVRFSVRLFAQPFIGFVMHYRIRE